MKYYSQNPIEWFWTRLTTERLCQRYLYFVPGH